MDSSLLTAEKINALTNEQLILITTPQLQAVKPSEISLIEPLQLMQLSYDQFKSFLPAQIAALSSEQIYYMSPEQANLLQPEQIASISSQELDTLEYVKTYKKTVPNFSKKVNDYICPYGYIKQNLTYVDIVTELPVTCILKSAAEASGAQASASIPTIASTSTLNTIPYMSTMMLSTSQGVQQIQASAAQAFTDQASAAQNAGISSFTVDQFNALTSEEIILITTPQLQALDPGEMSLIETSQFTQLTPDQFKSFLPEQLAEISGEQLFYMSPEQANALTAEQTASMSSEHLHNLEIVRNNNDAYPTFSTRLNNNICPYGYIVEDRTKDIREPIIVCVLKSAAKASGAEAFTNQASAAQNAGISSTFVPLTSTSMISSALSMSTMMLSTSQGVQQFQASAANSIALTSASQALNIYTNRAPIVASAAQLEEITAPQPRLLIAAAPTGAEVAAPAAPTAAPEVVAAPAPTAAEIAATKALAEQTAENQAAASAGPYTVNENGGMLAPYMKQAVALGMNLKEIQENTKLKDGTGGYWQMLIAELTNNNLTIDCVGAKRWLCTRGYLAYCPDFTPYMIALANCDESAIKSYYIDPASQFLQVGQELAKNNLAKNASGARKWLCKNGNTYYCNASGAAAPICTGNRDPNTTSYDVGQIYVGDYPSLPVIRAIAKNDSSYDRNPVTPTSLANTILRTFEIPENAKGAQLFLCATRGECDAIAGSATAAKDMNAIVMDSLKNQYSTRDILIRLRKNQSFVDAMFAPSGTCAPPENDTASHDDGMIASNKPLRPTETVGGDEISSYTIQPAWLPSNVVIDGLPPTITEIVIKDDNYVYPSLYNQSEPETAPGFPGSPNPTIQGLPGYVSSPVGYVIGFVDSSVGIQTAIVINARFGPSNYGSSYNAIYVDLDREIHGSISNDMMVYYGPPGTVFIKPSLKPAKALAAIASAKKNLGSRNIESKSNSLTEYKRIYDAMNGLGSIVMQFAKNCGIEGKIMNNIQKKVGGAALNTTTDKYAATQVLLTIALCNSVITDTLMSSRICELSTVNKSEEYNQMNAEQNNAEQYNTEQYNAEQNNAEQYNAEQNNAGQYNTEQYNAQQNNAEQYNTEQNNAEQYNTEQNNEQLGGALNLATIGAAALKGENIPTISEIYTALQELETNINTLVYKCNDSLGITPQEGGAETSATDCLALIDKCKLLMNTLVNNPAICPAQGGGRRGGTRNRVNRRRIGKKSKRAPRRKWATRRKASAPVKKSKKSFRYHRP